MPIIDLYKTALKISSSQLLVEMDDAYFAVASNYDPKNLYCYQLFLPPMVDEKKIQAIIVDDFNKQFDLHGRWEKREIPCLVITKQKKVSSRSDSADGISMESFVKKLNYANDITDSVIPFIDESGYSGRIMSSISISVLRKDRCKLEEVLESYGLSLVEAVRRIDFFVLSQI